MTHRNTRSHLLRTDRALLKHDPHAIRRNLRSPLRLHGDLLESLPNPLFERLDVFLASHSKLHSPCTVILCPPIDELLSRVSTSVLWLGPKGLIVARAELVVWMIRAEDVLLHLEEALETLGQL